MTLGRFDSRPLLIFADCVFSTGQLIAAGLPQSDQGTDPQSSRFDDPVPFAELLSLIISLLISR